MRLLVAQEWGNATPAMKRSLHTVFLLIHLLSVTCLSSSPPPPPPHPPPPNSSSSNLSSCFPEVVILEPRQLQRFKLSNAVRLRASVIHADSSSQSFNPGSWALSLSLDDEDSLIHEGLELDGLLPSLHPGPHSLTVSLVDIERHGVALGPRARVTIVVGEYMEPEVEIIHPRAQILQRDSRSESIAIQVRARNKAQHITLFMVWFDGIALHGDQSIVVDRDLWEWHRNISGLNDGLHTMDVHLVDNAGEITSKDRRYFQIITTDLLQSNQG